MANIHYLRCSKCGCDATPRKAVIKDGKIIQTAEVGTATTMRCRDCCIPKEAYAFVKDFTGYATMCRDCCPTGHGTKWEWE